MPKENKNNIENLFQKFRKDKLSLEDISEFYHVLDDETQADIVEHYYTKIWDESSKLHAEIEPDVLFSKIENTVQNEVQETKQINKNKRINPLPSLLKYAAIFLIAFATSWFGKDFFTGKDTTSKFTKDNIVEVSYGSKSKIQLPDGSVVNLNSGSRLTYPKEFLNNKREVYLSGEAFFMVEANEEKPFYVHTSDIIVLVTGTRFNVKSYPDSENIETTLVSGKLQILDKKKKNKALIVLSPEETAIYKKPDYHKKEQSEKKAHNLQSKNSATILLKKEPQVSETYAWKDNILVFNNEKFQNLAIRLERWYDVEIYIQNAKLANERFTGKFDKETIEQALDALQLIVPFKYSITKNNITIIDRTN